MESNVRVLPLHAEFAAEIRGVDLRQPLGAADLASLQAAFSKHVVLVFPGQDLNDDQQVLFAKNFGGLEPIETYQSGPKRRLQAQISDLSNLDADGKLWEENSRRRMFNLANMLWHTDSSFKPVAALCSMLSARSLPPPEGGQTQFTDLRAAYDALSDERKAAIGSLAVVHDIAHSRAQLGYVELDPELSVRLPPVHQRLVRTHPASGRKTLYLASHAASVVGQPLEQGQALLQELMDFATQVHFVYTHHWRQHDLVMWDNRCTMHRGIKYDDLRYTRDVRRTTVSEAANSLVLEPL